MSDNRQAGRHRRRRIIPWTWLLSLAIIASGLALYVGSPRGSSTNAAVAAAATNERPYTVRWNGPVTPAAAGVLFAIDHGDFSSQGLTVTLSAAADDATAVAAVSSDDHTIGQISAQAFLRARAGGSPIVAFATSYLASSVELYSLEPAIVETPGDLVGKVVGYDPATDCGAIVDALIRKQNLPRSGLRIVEAADPVAELIHGKVGVVAGHWEIEGAELRTSSAHFRTVTPDAFGVHVPGTLYVISQRAVSAHPDLSTRFLAGLFAGWQAAYASYDRAATLVSSAAGHRASAAAFADFMDGQRRYLRPLGTRMGELDLPRLRELQALLLTQGAIARPVDLNQAVDASTVSEVYRRQLQLLNAR